MIAPRQAELKIFWSLEYSPLHFNQMCLSEIRV